MATYKTLKKATFHKNVRRYLFWYGVVVLTLSVLGILFLPFWLLGIGRWYSRKYFKSLSCNLTERHLAFQKGILVTVEKTIPLENIQDLTFIEGPFLKAFGLSIMKIETAGNSSSSGSDMSLLGVENASSFKEEVFETRERILRNKGENTNATPEIEMVSLLREIRDLLKEKD